MPPVFSTIGNIKKGKAEETILKLKDILSQKTFPQNYGLSEESYKSLYDHSFDGDVDFNALEGINDILSKGVVLSPFKKSHTIKDKTGIICAPINVQDKRYYAVLVSGKKRNGFMYPYAIRVFEDDFIKEKLLEITRHSPQDTTDSNSHQKDNFQKFCANILINYIVNNSDIVKNPN